MKQLLKCLTLVSLIAGLLSLIGASPTVYTKPEVKATSTKTTIQAEPKPAVPPVVRWQDNPNGCAANQWIAKDPPFNCIDKPTRPAPVIASGSCADEIRKYNWPVSTALAVSRAESGLNAGSRGDTHLTYYVNGVRYGDSWGCFQIRYLPGRPAPSQLLNAAFNVSYAYTMYKSSGWQPWRVCDYKVACY